MAFPGLTWLINDSTGIRILVIFCLVQCIFLWSFGLVCKNDVLGIKSLVEESLQRAYAGFCTRIQISLGMVQRASHPTPPWVTKETSESHVHMLGPTIVPQLLEGLGKSEYSLLPTIQIYPLAQFPKDLCLNRHKGLRIVKVKTRYKQEKSSFSNELCETMERR